MAVSRDFLEHASELLAPLGGISHRRMFGGAGIYCDGVMIALVADDCLYLKTDEHNRAEFEAAGLEPFTFESRGKSMRTSYWRVPDEALDSASAMATWARGALAAALRKK